MTTDLEKQFFETFGIEKRCEFDKCCEDCKTCGCYHYPRLTDRILLELICIANHKDVYIGIEGTDIETIKNNLLENFIFFRRDVEKYVQALFKEGKLCN